MNDLDKTLRDLRRQGFSVTKGRSNHWKVRDKSGRLIAGTGSTPSDYRSLRNFKSRLRRAGASL